MHIGSEQSRVVGVLILDGPRPMRLVGEDRAPVSGTGRRMRARPSGSRRPSERRWPRAECSACAMIIARLSTSAPVYAQHKSRLLCMVEVDGLLHWASLRAHGAEQLVQGTVPQSLGPSAARPRERYGPHSGGLPSGSTRSSRQVGRPCAEDTQSTATQLKEWTQGGRNFRTISSG